MKRRSKQGKLHALAERIADDEEALRDEGIDIVTVGRRRLPVVVGLGNADPVEWERAERVLRARYGRRVRVMRGQFEVHAHC